jgi:hypothetical protein
MGRPVLSVCLLSEILCVQNNLRILMNFAPDGFRLGLLLMLCAKIQAAVSNRNCKLCR